AGGHGRDDKRGRECRRNELSQADLAGVLLNDAHLPVSILEVLAPQRAGIPPHGVGRSDARAEQNTTPEIEKAIIQLLVLIAYHLLVEQARPLQHLPPPGPHLHARDPLLLLRVP